MVSLLKFNKEKEMKFIKITIALCIFSSLTACAKPKSEINIITFNSPHSLNDDTRDKIIVYELLEPMKSYCNLYYLTIGYNPENRIKNQERFFHYGTCLFDIKEWESIPNLTFRYTAIPRKQNMVFCDPAYLDNEEMKTCTKIDDHIDNIYHTIPQDAWNLHTINTKEIIENSIKDKDPIGKKEHNLNITSSKFKERNDRYVELRFHAVVIDNKIEHTVDVLNYWKHQHKSLWH